MILSYIIPTLLTVLFVALFLIDRRRVRKQHDYMKSLQEQIDRLRNEHALHAADSKRLADAVASIQRTHLGLPESQVFKSNLHS